MEHTGPHSGQDLPLATAAHEIISANHCLNHHAENEYTAMPRDWRCRVGDPRPTATGQRTPAPSILHTTLCPSQLCRRQVLSPGTAWELNHTFAGIQQGQNVIAHPQLLPDLCLCLPPRTSQREKNCL